jgi:predicted GH43/DUF377 family glycosyl hydrolase
MVLSPASQSRSRGEGAGAPEHRSRALPAPGLQTLPVRIEKNPRRVVPLPFGVGDGPLLEALFEQVRRLDEAAVEGALAAVARDFAARHEQLDDDFDRHYRSAAAHLRPTAPLSAAQQRLLGAYCTMEYAVEAAALCNPSMVVHPSQEEAPPGGLRFVMSLRAVGEGHLSSTVFQTGTIDAGGGFSLDMPGLFSDRAETRTEQRYEKELSLRKLAEMGAHLRELRRVTDRLGAFFTMAELEEALAAEQEAGDASPAFREGCSTLRWLARANYELELAPEDRLCDLILFPRSDSERRGIEDMRLVRFTAADGQVTYYGTYTGYDGVRILPMLMETRDFRRVRVHTLNGACIQNKGMALFPRPVDGHYLMCSRLDGRRLFLMASDYLHFWETATPLAEPRHGWELRQIGNCGSPLETPEGWLLITHGVGPMRRYCLGAMLLDLDDPFRVRGRLKEPLLEPSEADREGYTPNVVYSCGSLIHRDVLYLPYAVADSATRIATVRLDWLLDRLLRDGA